MDKKRFFEAVIIFLIGFFVFSSNIGGLYIYSLDEAKNSECAREMLERGDFIVPTFNYELRTDKPPIHYYFMIVSYKIFGVSEFSARFFSSVFGALTLLITFLFSKRYFGFLTGFFSFIVLLSSLHTAVQFHMAVPDPYLIFWINASLFSFFVWYKEGKNLFLWFFYIFSGLGVLTKGPVAVVLPFFIVACFLFLQKDIQKIKDMKPFKGFFLILLISLPWYIAVGLKTDWVWIKEFIFKHNIHRFSAPMEGHGGIFLITFLYVFIGLLPFSIFLPQTLKKVLINRKNDLILFLTVFSLVYVGFFAISKTKLPNYTVPAYPPLAVLLGFYLSSLKKPSKSIFWSLSTYILITVLIVIGLYYGIKGEKEISNLSYLSFYFLLLTGGGVVSFLLLKRDWILSLLSLSFSSVLMTLLFFFYLFPKIDMKNPVAQMLPLIDKKKEIRYYKSFNPAFVFYLRRHIKPIEKKGIKRFLSKKDRVFILSRKRYKNDILKYKKAFLLKEVKDLFENKTSILVSNKKSEERLHRRIKGGQK